MSIVKSLLWVSGGLLLVALFAQTTLNVNVNDDTIPVTGQSLAVLVVGFLWPRPLGVLAIGLYLLSGALGLPVFADGESGWAQLAGPSAGYLWGFLVAAEIMSLLALRGWGFSFLRSLLAMAIGTAVILFVGLTRLALLHGWAQAVEWGLAPFWKGALVKILLGAIIAWWFRCSVCFSGLRRG